MLNAPMSKRKSHRNSPKNQAKSVGKAGGSAPKGDWIYGRHAVLAALANPNRQCHRLVASENQAEPVRRAGTRDGLPPLEVLNRQEIDRLLPRDAVHQGLAVLAAPLPSPALEDICETAADQKRAAVLVLDQATDPHNIGAVLRSAAAFGALAVVMQDRHAPDATGALAKAASGALDTVPLVQTTNLSRALGQLKDAGFWCLGLDGEARTSLQDADLTGKIALVLGAEGSGLRRLVRENCDHLIRIPIQDRMESLNLSNAAAVSLYEWARRAH